MENEMSKMKKVLNLNYSCMFDGGNAVLHASYHRDKYSRHREEKVVVKEITQEVYITQTRAGAEAAADMHKKARQRHEAWLKKEKKRLKGLGGGYVSAEEKLDTYMGHH